MEPGELSDCAEPCGKEAFSVPREEKQERPNVPLLQLSLSKLIYEHMWGVRLHHAL